jgi:ankyrin repeat protein
MKLLVEKGADVKSKGGVGQTPLSRAVRRGHEAVVKLLLKKGAVVKSKDGVGQTPLSRAVRQGHEAIVKLLVEKGPTWNPRMALTRRRYCWPGTRRW